MRQHRQCSLHFESALAASRFPNSHFKRGSDGTSKPRLFRLTVNLATVGILTWLVIVAGTVGATQLVSPSNDTDPFTPYEAILLGSSVDDALCAAQLYDPTIGQSVCEIMPTSRVFDKIKLFRDDAYPLWVDIAFWSGQLRVADLVLRWGRPDTIRREGAHYVLDWQQSQVQAYTWTAGYFTYLALVPLVQWQGSGPNAEAG